MSIHFPQERYPALELFLRKLVMAEVPFVPGGRDPDKGLDCAGLVISSLAHVGANLKYVDRVYGTYWYLESMAEEVYLEELRKSFAVFTTPLRDDPVPGDLMLYRMKPGGPVSHAGFLLANGQMCSTYNGRCVCTSAAMSRFWLPKFYGYAAPKPEVFE